jgi:hypothetical protein
MANIIPRRKSKKQRVLGSVKKVVKARIAWIAGKKAARVAAPAVAVGVGAAIAKKRSGSHTAAAV